jgi:hypothetical protein
LATEIPVVSFDPLTVKHDLETSKKDFSKSSSSSLLPVESPPSVSYTYLVRLAESIASLEFDESPNPSTLSTSYSARTIANECVQKQLQEIQESIKTLTLSQAVADRQTQNLVAQVTDSEAAASPNNIVTNSDSNRNNSSFQRRNRGWSPRG